MLNEHSLLMERLKAAETTFRAAQYDDALDMIEGCEDWDAPINEEAVCLKAEILSRRNPLESLHHLANCQDIFVTERGKFNYFVANGREYANTRSFATAQTMFREARKLLKSDDADLLPRVALQESRLRWMQGEFDPECIELTQALGDPTPSGKIAALLVRGWMHAGLEHYDLQVNDFLSALQIASQHPDKFDVATIGRVLHSMLRVSMETGDAQGMAAGQEALEQLKWTPDVQVDHFQATRVLGWHSFLQGEGMRAQRYFKTCHSLAPSTAWQIMAHLDRASVASISQNDLWAMEELYEADRLSDEVTWEATSGEERFALVTLAVLFAKSDMARALHYVALYNQIGTDSIQPTLAIVHDRRATAIERYASGRVQQVLGEIQLAEQLLTEAYEIFTHVGYHYRAAITGLALHEVSGDPVWQERSLEHASRYPNSRVPEQIEQTKTQPEDAIFVTLTPSQKQVFLAICEGLSVAEIAARFRRSVFAINKHLQTVYDAFSVNTHKDLRAEAKRRNLFGRVFISSFDTHLKLEKA